MHRLVYNVRYLLMDFHVFDDTAIDAAAFSDSELRFTKTRNALLVAHIGHSVLCVKVSIILKVEYGGVMKSQSRMR